MRSLNVITLVIVLFVVLLAAGPSHAAVVVSVLIDEIQGIFADPVGGNPGWYSGVGTAGFATGRPAGAPGSGPSRWIFGAKKPNVALPPVVYYTCGFMTNVNAITLLGTEASGVDLLVSGTGRALVDEGDGPFVFRGFIFSDRIHLQLITTLNTDDPRASADITRSNRFPHDLKVPEKSFGSTDVFGYLNVSVAPPAAAIFPSGTDWINSDQLSVDFRLVDFVPPTDGDAFLEPNPEYVPEPSAVVVWLGILACPLATTIGRQVRRKT